MSHIGWDFIFLTLYIINILPKWLAVVYFPINKYLFNFKKGYLPVFVVVIVVVAVVVVVVVVVVLVVDT